MAEAPSAVPPWSLVVVPQAVSLGSGEEILLAIRPSPWFILLVSWPVLAMAAVVAVLVHLARNTLQIQTFASHTVLSICTLAALIRLLAGLVQWLGRTYILTNLRIMQVRGIGRWDVKQCPLQHIARVHVSAMVTEKLVALGSLTFETAKGVDPEMSWLHVSRPGEVREIIEGAIRRSK